MRITEGACIEVCMEFHWAPRRQVTEPAQECILGRGSNTVKGESIWGNYMQFGMSQRQGAGKGKAGDKIDSPCCQTKKPGLYLLDKWAAVMSGNSGKQGSILLPPVYICPKTPSFWALTTLQHEPLLHVSHSIFIILVLVIYCCVTNYPQHFSSLKTHIF